MLCVKEKEPPKRFLRGINSKIKKQYIHIFLYLWTHCFAPYSYRKTCTTRKNSVMGTINRFTSVFYHTSITYSILLYQKNQEIFHRLFIAIELQMLYIIVL